MTAAWVPKIDVDFFVFRDNKRILVNSYVAPEELHSALADILPEAMTTNERGDSVMANGWTKGIIW